MTMGATPLGDQVAKVILEIPTSPTRFGLCVFPFFLGLDSSDDRLTCMHFPRNVIGFWGCNLPKFHKCSIASKVGIFAFIWELVPPTSMIVFDSLSRSMGSPCTSAPTSLMHFTIWVSYIGWPVVYSLSSKSNNTNVESTNNQFLKRMSNSWVAPNSMLSFLICGLIGAKRSLNLLYKLLKIIATQFIWILCSIITT